MAGLFARRQSHRLPPGGLMAPHQRFPQSVLDDVAECAMRVRRDPLVLREQAVVDGERGADDGLHASKHHMATS